MGAAISDRRPRVLILGGGFAGVGAAQKLGKTDADVVLVDRHDYHTFQPLLYQLATGLLGASSVGHSLRDLVGHQANTTIHRGSVTAVDLAAKKVQFADLPTLPYDYLVLALGAQVNYFGTDGASANAFPMYTLPDAERLKGHLIERWEAADRDPTLIEDGALNVVVVGGGPTGVETAGAVAELYRHDFAKDYPDVSAEQARVTLVELGSSLLTMFKPQLRTYAKKALTDRSVHVRTGEQVASVSPTRVTLKSGEEIRAHTLVWGAGLQGNPVAHTLGLELERGNRIAVGEDLSLPGHPDVFVLGDAAAITDHKTGQVLPQLGSVALQSGKHTGRNVARLIAGTEPTPFLYHDKGTMAAIGRGAACVQLRGRTLMGRKAQLGWLAVHLVLLPTNGDRARSLVNWMGAAINHERPGRFTVGST